LKEAVGVKGDEELGSKMHFLNKKEKKSCSFVDDGASWVTLATQLGWGWVGLTFSYQHLYHFKF